MCRKNILSRPFWRLAETKISAGQSRVTGPAELIEMAQYVPAPRLARLMIAATKHRGPTNGTVSTWDMFFSKATGYFKLQRNLSGTFTSASTPYVEGSDFYHSAFTNLHWLHHQRCSERVPPLIFNSSLHCSPKTTVHGCQK